MSGIMLHYILLFAILVLGIVAVTFMALYFEAKKEINRMMSKVLTDLAKLGVDIPSISKK